MLDGSVPLDPGPSKATAFTVARSGMDSAGQKRPASTPVVTAWQDDGNGFDDSSVPLNRADEAPSFPVIAGHGQHREGTGVRGERSAQRRLSSEKSHTRFSGRIRSPSK